MSKKSDLLDQKVIDLLTQFAKVNTPEQPALIKEVADTILAIQKRNQSTQVILTWFVGNIYFEVNGQRMRVNDDAYAILTQLDDISHGKGNLPGLGTGIIWNGGLNGGL
ncbi:hypothetical protein [Lacticaseibacillus brantae]|nr:hypothetical protein [Lacticaseibacillus brantae]